MVIWNLLDGGLSHSITLLGPSESMRGGTPGTNPCQRVSCTREKRHSFLSFFMFLCANIHISKYVPPFKNLAFFGILHYKLIDAPIFIAVRK
jgi:hypothetical protein